MTSTVVEDELTATRDPFSRERFLAQLTDAAVWLELNERAVRLARLLEQKGLARYDALHVAVAYTGRCDVFLTTDQRLIRRMARLSTPLGMLVINPVELKL